MPGELPVPVAKIGLKTLVDIRRSLAGTDPRQHVLVCIGNSFTADREFIQIDPSVGVVHVAPVHMEQTSFVVTIDDESDFVPIGEDTGVDDRTGSIQLGAD